MRMDGVEWEGFIIIRKDFGVLPDPDALNGIHLCIRVT